MAELFLIQTYEGEYLQTSRTLIHCTLVTPHNVKIHDNEKGPRRLFCMHAEQRIA
jgi:hypothetical protein